MNEDFSGISCNLFILAGDAWEFCFIRFCFYSFQSLRLRLYLFSLIYIRLRSCIYKNLIGVVTVIVAFCMSITFLS